MTPCFIDIEVIGEKLDVGLDLSEVRVDRLRLVRSEIREVRCNRCSFGGTPGAQDLSIVDSTVAGSVVLRSGGLPEDIPSALIEPGDYGPSRSTCAPASTLPNAPLFDIPLRIDGTKIGGRLDLDLLRFGKEVRVRDSTIGSPIEMDRTTFLRGVDLQGTRSRVFSATGATFEGDTRLFRGTADRDAVFECARFEGPLNMLGFATPGIVNMRRATFRSTAPAKSDAGGPAALDGIRAEGLDLAGAYSAEPISVTAVSLSWLSLLNFEAAATLAFGGGKIDRLLIYDETWFSLHRDVSRYDLSAEPQFPGYRTDGLESVQLGSIEPDEAYSSAHDARMTHVLQFLRHSSRSLGAYDVVRKEYESNGKTLWANHIAFCQAERKNDPFLRYTGAMRRFGPEVPLLAAFLLLLLDIYIVLRHGIRSTGPEIVVGARALAGATTSGRSRELPLLRQRLLRAAKPIHESPMTEEPPNLDLRDAQAALALAVVRAEWAFSTADASFREVARQALDRAVEQVEAFWDAGPVGNPWTKLLVASSSPLALIQVGPARQYEVTDPWGRKLRAVNRVAWGLVLAWAVAVFGTFIR